MPPQKITKKALSELFRMSRKIELLAPGGDVEAIKAAIVA